MNQLSWRVPSKSPKELRKYANIFNLNEEEKSIQIDQLRYELQKLNEYNIVMDMFNTNVSYKFTQSYFNRMLVLCDDNFSTNVYGRDIVIYLSLNNGRHKIIIPDAILKGYVKPRD